MKSNRDPLNDKTNRKGGIPFWEKMKPKKNAAPVAAKKSVEKNVERSKERGWDDVAKWYDKLVGDEGSDYHKHVIVPALMKRLGDIKGKKMLDLCCGQGFLGRILLEAGAGQVVGVDASEQLIRAASDRAPRGAKSRYICADASAPGSWADQSHDEVVCLMAVHDVENLRGLFRNAAAALNKGGTLHLVMMHPCFRVPQHTHWGWDEEKKIQYRRVDHYGSERKIEITTHPGKKSAEKTIFYHRPLASYVEMLSAAGLLVSGCEELYSHRRSQKGPRSVAEHTAAEEFPMFLYLAAKK